MTVPAVRDYLRAIAADPAGAADADLLARFAQNRDEAAFELLVWRHAAMVQGVCRAVLRDRHAAEDAAQAAFLVVARKANTFAGRGAVVGWLYRVARRTAVRLARRRAKALAPLPHPDRLPAAPAADPVADAEAAALLWAEVDRLPDRYRVPVLLCHVEGLTHPEAARRTGWPVGTVAGRLARARELLGRRLTRKGVAPAAAAVGVPAGAFAGATARAAALFAGRQPVVGVSPVVLSLAEGVTRTMTLFPLKLAAAAAALATGLAAGVWAAHGPAPAENPGAAAAPADEPAGRTPPLAAAGKPAAKPADAATRMQVTNNLKQVLLAFHNYHDTYNRLPADITDRRGKPLLSWRVAVLPFIEQDQLYRQFKLDEPWDSEHNKPLLARMPKLYQTGGAAGDTETHIQGLDGPGGLFERGKKIPLIAGIPDGTSNTLAVLVAGDPVPWSKPADIPFDPKDPKVPASAFPNVLLIGMADGSVRAAGPKVPADLFRLLAVRDDGEVIGDELPKPDLRATTKEDQALADELRRRIEVLRAEAEELVAARDKMLTEKQAGRRADLDALMEEHRQLAQQVERLREQVERLRTGEGPKPKPVPKAPTAPVKP